MKIPKYQIGSYLQNQMGFIGEVDAIFANFEAAVNCGIVDRLWWNDQICIPSTENQIFYSIVKTDGAVLVGENEAKELTRDECRFTANHSSQH